MMRTTIRALVPALLVAAGCYGSHSEDDDARDDGGVRDDGGARDDAVIRDDAGDAADDAAGPGPIRFRLHFVSDIPESVWVAAWDASVVNAFFRIREEIRDISQKTSASDSYEWPDAPSNEVFHGLW